MRRKWRKKDLYIANFLRDEYDDEGNKISTYDKPIYIGKENIQPLSGQSDIVEYGTRVTKMQKVLLDTNFKIKNNNKVKNIDGLPVKELDVMTVKSLTLKYNDQKITIKENDLAYLDGAIPESEQVNGDNANYRVDSVRYQNKKIAIYFEKLPNK